MENKTMMIYQITKLMDARDKDGIMLYPKKMQLAEAIHEQVYSKLIQENVELRAMLKKHEFCADDMAVDNLCPECRGGWFPGIHSFVKYDGIHSQECELARLISDVHVAVAFRWNEGAS